MASLDPLLRAMLEHRGEALVLEPGELPRLVLDGREREVTTTRLERRLLHRLLREVAPEGRMPEPGEEPWTFHYTLEGTPFSFEGSPSTEGWRVRVTQEEAPEDGEDVDDGEDDATGRAADRRSTSRPAAAEEQVEVPEEAPRVLTDLVPLLEELMRREGSDLHISAGQQPFLRIHGEMEPLPYKPLGSEQLIKMLFKLAPERAEREFLERHDTDFAYAMSGKARFRVNLFRERLGVGAVFRWIPQEVPTAEDLSLPETIRQMAFLSKGLVVVTGPTGSGKSTTLAALVDLINRSRRDHLITIEDPIEFVHSSRSCLIHQREVGEHTSSFKNALRAALREDPDIILLGEMRDLETTAIAIETAETGHLVFGTLHTTSAPATVERLINQFPAGQQEQIRMMLADSLRGVVSQVLLRRRQGGRVAAFEILVCTPAVSNLIREGKTFQIRSLMQTGRRLGMAQLNDALFELVRNGTVEAREAVSRAVDRESLVSRLKAEGVEVSLGTDAD